MIGRKRSRCDEDVLETSFGSSRSTSSSERNISKSVSRGDRATNYYYSHSSRDRSRNYAHKSHSQSYDHRQHHSQSSSRHSREYNSSGRSEDLRKEGRDQNINHRSSGTRHHSSPKRNSEARRTHSGYSRECHDRYKESHEARSSGSRGELLETSDYHKQDRYKGRSDKSRRDYDRRSREKHHHSLSSRCSISSAGSSYYSDSQSDSESGSSSDDDYSSSSDSENDSDSMNGLAWELDQGAPDEVWFSANPDSEAVRKLQICSIPDDKCIPLLTEKYLDTVKGCTSIITTCFKGVRINGYKGRCGEQGGVVDEWRFDDILGLGHGSTVLAGLLAVQGSKNRIVSEQMAFKLVLKSHKASRIAGVEAPLLRKLNGNGFPKLFFRLSRRMRRSKYRVVVLAVDRHGTSLDESAGELGLREAFIVGIHLVQALRRLHLLGWAHLSIKPENICWGLKNNVDDHSTCVLLDLERAERIGEKISETTKGLAPFCGRTGVFQALRLYSSPLVLPTHDLESVYYIMMSLILSPKLSQWTDYVNSSMSRNAEIERKKRHELDSGYFPHARKRFGAAADPLKNYLQCVREGAPSAPDYDFLISILANGL